MKKHLVVIPTYNEKDNIERLVRRLLNVRPDLDVLVVDDNSPDGTGRILDALVQENARVKVIHRAGKQGLGSAYVQGFKHSLSSDEYTCVITMDADLSHRPRYIPQLLECAKDHDLVVGSRWMPGGKISNWSFLRIFLSRAASLYAGLVLGSQIKDWTGGFNCYRCDALRGIKLDEVRADGYSFQIEMKYRILKNAGHVLEIPITFPDRKAGKSKISRRIVFEAIILVWWYRFSPQFRRKT